MQNLRHQWFISGLLKPYFLNRENTESLLTSQKEVWTSDLLVKYSHFYDAKVQAELASWLEISDYELCYASDNVKI